MEYKVRSGWFPLFKSGSDSFWTVFLEYEDVLLDHEEKTKKQQIPELDTSQKLLLDKLFEIRRTLAEKEGIPVFIIASNKQLSDVAVKMPKTHDQLKNINGFGARKIKKYGNAIIELVKAFDQKEDAGKTRAEDVAK